MRSPGLFFAGRLLGLVVLACGIPACHYNRAFGSIDWFVDPIFGDDFNFDGSPRYPFRTITRALRFSISGDAIFLAPGTYSASSGEVFPLFVKPGVLIQGDPGTKGVGPVATFVTGGGVYTITGGTQATTTVTTAFVMGTGSALSGVKITVPGANGIGVAFDGFSASLSDCTLTGNGASGIRIYQTGSPTITGNVISSNSGSGVDVFDGGAGLDQS